MFEHLQEISALASDTQELNEQLQQLQQWKDYEQVHLSVQLMGETGSHLHGTKRMSFNLENIPQSVLAFLIDEKISRLEAKMASNMDLLKIYTTQGDK